MSACFCLFVAGRNVSVSISFRERFFSPYFSPLEHRRDHFQAHGVVIDEEHFQARREGRVVVVAAVVAAGASGVFGRHRPTAGVVSFVVVDFDVAAGIIGWARSPRRSSRGQSRPRHS